MNHIDERLTMVDRTIHPDDLKELVAEEMRGDVCEEDRAWLIANPDIWYEGLIGFKEDLDSQLATRAASMALLKNESLKAGPSGKQRWFEEDAEYGQWRARVVYLKSLTERRIAYARRLRHEFASNDSHNLVERVRKLERQIESLLNA